MYIYIIHNRFWLSHTSTMSGVCTSCHITVLYDMIWYDHINNQLNYILYWKEKTVLNTRVYLLVFPSQPFLFYSSLISSIHRPHTSSLISSHFISEKHFVTLEIMVHYPLINLCKIIYFYCDDGPRTNGLSIVDRRWIL